MFDFLTDLQKPLQSWVQKLNRAAVAFCVDVMLAASSILIGLLLRVGGDIVKYKGAYIAKHMIVFGLVCASVFWLTRLHKVVWRYVSVRELQAVVQSVSIAVVIYAGLWFLLSAHQALPRSLLVLSWVLSIVFIGGVRFAYRLFCDFRERQPSSSVEAEQRKKLLLVGVNDQSEKFIRASQNMPDSPFEIIGLVDEGTSRIGRQVHGIDVRGTISSLKEVLSHLEERKLSPEMIVISELHGGGAVVRQVFADCEAAQIPVRRLPNLSDWATQQISPASLNPVALEDLLQRPQVSLERDSVLNLIAGQKVLVTGAGGSIGSELVRQICAFKPQQIVLLDNSEYALYNIHQEISENFPEMPCEMVLADVADGPRIKSVMQRVRPHLVFHAAALKHVPIVEMNPIEAIITNAIGTQLVAEACSDNQVQAMVMISTDKAITPSCVMGATKRLAEKYCQSLDCSEKQDNQSTRFITVRFGNVLGSTGSVIPLFQRQIQQGGPVTITDPKMRRYFMTIAEAVELVLQAGTLGIKSESHRGQIYVLDMGEPLYVEEVARHLIRLAGLLPDQDIKIKYVGTRPGEKLEEELFYAHEKKIATSCDLINIAYSSNQHGDISNMLKELEIAARRHDYNKTMHLLQVLVPEYASPLLQKVG